MKLDGSVSEGTTNGKIKGGSIGGSHGGSSIARYQLATLNPLFSLTHDKRLTVNQYLLNVLPNRKKNSKIGGKSAGSGDPFFRYVIVGM